MFNDPVLNIDWRLQKEKLCLYGKGQNQPDLKELESGFVCGIDFYD